MLLPPLNRLLQLLEGGLLIRGNLFHAASLSSHDNAGAQLGAVQFLQVYSLYFADNF